MGEARRRQSRSRTPTGSPQTPRLSLDWLAEHATVALTVGGILLYATMRLTYGLYYGLLGTSPEEVGLGYTQLLGQSALSVGAGALLAVALAVWITLILAYVGLFIKGSTMIRMSTVRWDELSDAEYLEHLALVRARVARHLPNMAAGLPTPGDALTLRHLATRPATTKEQRTQKRAELKRARENLGVTTSSLIAGLTRDLGQFVRRRMARILVFSALCVGLLVMPVISWTAAGLIKDCNEAAARGFGLFGLRGDPAHLVGQGASALNLGKSELYLLGSSEDQIIVYDCVSGRTIRVRKQDDVAVVTEP